MWCVCVGGGGVHTYVNACVCVCLGGWCMGVLVVYVSMNIEVDTWQVLG